MYPVLFSIPLPVADAPSAASVWPVTSYGILLFLSLVMGWWLTKRQARRADLNQGTVAVTTLVALTAGLFSAKLGFLALLSSEAVSLSGVLALFRGGLWGFGAIWGALLAAAMWSRRAPHSWRSWLDCAVPGFVVAAVLIRLGCYAHGCDFGRGAASLGILARLGTYPAVHVAGWQGSAVWLTQLTQGLLEPGAQYTHAVHPTPLYEVSACLLLGAGLTASARLQSFSGQLGLLALMGYSLLRALLDFWRGDPDRGLVGPELELRWALALVLLGAGAAVAYGPALSLTSLRRRLSALLLLPALAVMSLLFMGTAPIVQLSASQWAALVTLCGASLLWARFAAHAPPELRASGRQP